MLYYRLRVKVWQTNLLQLVFPGEKNKNKKLTACSRPSDFFLLTNETVTAFDITFSETVDREPVS